MDSLPIEHANSPTVTDDYLSDGAGQHIQKQSVRGSTTTTTTYIGGGIEEAQSVNGRAVTLTMYLGYRGCHRRSGWGRVAR